MEDLKRLALERLGLPEGRGERTRDEFATVLGPRELDVEARIVLADVLASRLRASIGERSGGRQAVALVSAEIEVSDQADCEDAQGHLGSAFVTDQRCYRIRVGLIIEPN